MKSKIPLIILLAAIAGRVSAQGELALTKIADASTPVPGATGTTFKDYHNPAIHNGQVVFRAINSSNAPGLYLFDGSAIVRIADTNTPAPNGGSFTNIQFDYGLENGAVAFHAEDTNGAALFLWTNGIITRLARRGDAIPGTATNKFTTFGQPAFDNGVLYFIGADSTNYRGVHRFDGAISTGLVSSLHTYPATALPHQFSSQIAVESNRLAVWSYANSNTQPNAIFTWTNGVKIFLVSSNDAIPGAGPNFYTFQSPPDMRDGMVAFWGGSVANLQEGIFVRPFDGGAITPMARRNDPNLGTSGGLTSFNGFSLDDGLAWFYAGGSGGESLFFWDGNAYRRVLSSGMKLASRTLASSSTFGFAQGGYRGGVAAFVAKFNDTTRALYITTNLPPATNAIALTLTNLVTTNTALPGGTGNFTSIGAGFLWQGGVVFSGSGTNSQGGLYRWQNGNLSVILNRASLYPGSSTNITFVGAIARDATQLALQIGGAGGQFGLFIYDGNSFTLVADTTTAIPGGSFGNFNNFVRAQFNGAKFTFQGSGTNSYSGLFEFDGSNPTRLVDVTSPFPGGTDFLRVVNFAQQGDLLGLVAFDGAGNSLQGVMTYSNGVFSLIATNFALMPGRSDRAYGFITALGFQGHDLFFSAQANSTVDGFSGTYLLKTPAGSATASIVIDENTTFPGILGSVSVSGFFIEPDGLYISANNGSQRGLYRFDNDIADLLFLNNAPLNGASVSFITPTFGSLSTNGAVIQATTSAGAVLYYAAPASTGPSGGQFTPGSLVYSPGGEFCFTFGNASSGNTYRIQYTLAPGSSNWVTLTNFTYTAPVTVCDPGATNQVRIYRAVSP